ncbi:hypothetical protein [Paenibacillus sp. GP183]|uniref:hypothetical protein n=1 Tax=Paenibacillus sp. GP183 TaxID=1882751 RepID=UPI0008949614|nr:hypothetical protein [Paenibacillus sp. GP183]SEB82110.1 hypothetical protein SAMN05443246_2019 [Paenibacillus sp. GP183]
MTKNRTYKLSDIASKLGKMRTTVADWANQFREYLPTVGSGRSLRYTEEAINIFEIISKMRDANKSPKYIKDHLTNLGQKLLIATTDDDNDEKPLQPEFESSNVQLSKETMELRNIIQKLTQKIEANKLPNYLKDPHLNDMNQKVVIAMKHDGNTLTPDVETSSIHLNKEVLELRNFINILTEKINEVLEQDVRSEITETAEILNRRYDGVFEEVMELRNLIQILAEKINEVLEQDIRSEITETAEILNRRYDDVSEEVKELRNFFQIQKEKINEVMEQDVKNIIADTAESLNRRYDSVIVEVLDLSKNIQTHTEKEMTELRNVIQLLTEKTNEVLEQDVKSEIVVTAESMNRQYAGISEEVLELRNLIQILTEKTNEVLEHVNNEITDTAESLNIRYAGISEEVTELRNVIQLLTEKTNEVLEQDVKSEMTDTAESLNRRYDSVFEEVLDLRKNMQTHTEIEISELRNAIRILTEKTNEVLEQDVKNEIADTAESLNRRYDSVFEEVLDLRKNMQAHTEIEISELRNAIRILTEKTNEVLEQDVKSEIADTVDSLNSQYTILYEQMMIQQQQIDELKKFLTWNP